MDVQTKALAEAARLDFGTYIAIVHETDNPEINGGAAVPAAHHERIIEALTTFSEHTLVVMPRGAAKTTYVQAWLEWSLGQASLHWGDGWQNRWRVLYVTGSESQAVKVSNAFKATLEGRTRLIPYGMIFPAVRPDMNKWSEREWKVQGNTLKDSTFQASGLFGAALGTRAPLMVFDDPVTEDAKISALEMERIIDALDKTFMPILTPEGRAVMTTTRWAWRDPAWWAEERGWKKVYQKALDDEGRSYWPQVWPTEKLLALRSQNEQAFAQQYQGEVAPEEGEEFLREWFGQRFEMLPADGEILGRVDSWDTASGQGRKRSYTVGLSAVITRDGCIYIWEMDRGQIPYGYQREAIKARVSRNRTDYVLIEAKSTGIALIQDQYADLGWNRWRRRRLVEVYPSGERGGLGGKSKEMARRDVQEFCKRGLVRLPSYEFTRRTGSQPWLYDFERDLFSYPNGQTDDVVSALAQLVSWVRLHPGMLLGWGGEPKNIQWAKRPGTRALV